jgi:hypothetical protein
MNELKCIGCVVIYELKCIGCVVIVIVLERGGKEAPKAPGTCSLFQASP